jgi:hypothetical protein
MGGVVKILLYPLSGEMVRIVASLRNQLGVSVFGAWTIICRVIARRKTAIVVYLRTAKKGQKYCLSESIKLNKLFSCRMVLRMFLAVS